MNYIVIHIKADDNRNYTIKFEGTKQSENDHTITFKRSDNELFTYRKEKVISYQILNLFNK